MSTEVASCSICGAVQKSGKGRNGTIVSVFQTAKGEPVKLTMLQNIIQELVLKGAVDHTYRLSLPK